MNDVGTSSLSLPVVARLMIVSQRFHRATSPASSLIHPPAACLGHFHPVPQIFSIDLQLNSADIMILVRISVSSPHVKAHLPPATFTSIPPPSCHNFYTRSGICSSKCVSESGTIVRWSMWQYNNILSRLTSTAPYPSSVLVPLLSLSVDTME